jgi:hypothetical protein
MLQISSINARGEGPFSALTFPIRMPDPVDSDSDAGEDAAAVASRQQASEAKRSKVSKLLVAVQQALIRRTDRVFFPSRAYGRMFDLVYRLSPLLPPLVSWRLPVTASTIAL